MPRKKKEEEIEETQSEAVEEGSATEELEASAADTDSQEAAAADETPEEGASLIESITETIASAVETVTDTASSVVETVSEAVGIGGGQTGKTGRGNRQEKIGVVASDKMQKTVVVRVDRLVKHPMYRKYVKKRKKFMAHDELGASIGDKVKIVETRPLSAHKRWRVVEILHKAEK